MIMGHYAAALVPRNRLPEAPLWLLLVCSQLPDFVWLVLALLGIEAPTPTSFLELSLIGMRVEMPYSHTGLGALVQTVTTALIVQIIWKRKELSLWCGALVFVHELFDLLSGFRHEVLTVGTPKIGLGLYETSPYIAFVVEAVVSLGLVWWYIRAETAAGRAPSFGRRVALYAVFVGGSLFFIGNARHSLRELLGL